MSPLIVKTEKKYWTQPLQKERSLKASIKPMRKIPKNMRNVQSGAA